MDYEDFTSCIFTSIEMILPKPGDVFLKEWTKGDKDQTFDVLEQIYAMVKKY